MLGGRRAVNVGHYIAANGLIALAKKPSEAADVRAKKKTSCDHSVLTDYL
jgi:hypothetical protein